MELIVAIAHHIIYLCALPLLFTTICIYESNVSIIPIFDFKCTWSQL